MLLHQIRTAVDNRIDNTVYWTDAKKTAFANDCLRSIVGHFKIRFRGYWIFYTIESQQRYIPPVDFIANEYLYTNTDSLNRTIIFRDGPAKSYGQYSNVDTIEGSPVDVFLWPVDDKPVLWFRPIPDKQYKMEQWYYREAPLLVEDDDQPIIDSNFHNWIVDYIEWKIKVADGDMAELAFIALWDTVLAKMSIAKTSQISDTIDFKPGTGRRNFPADVGGDIVTLSDPTGTYLW